MFTDLTKHKLLFGRNYVPLDQLCLDSVVKALLGDVANILLLRAIDWGLCELPAFTNYLCKSS